ncbi:MULTISPECIES: hypothetical protein [Desulfobacula]|uniref:DUF3311 domain-containing protein n=2 Tax=Desulfobacula TaxID=28222 RepID=K0NC09_DESTT|nr:MULTISPECIES: hypothetical protein [Desulfobacula]CCK78286.1 uncharacterized protein TOL2_C01160 [Desulfobacula toluolica Tol2]SDU57465.1 hypothetical protein SAMN04487931_11399 [Desulfobacula phenolica]
MLDSRSIKERYIGLFLFACFLFCYPVLTIFNLPIRLFGIPLFFLYIFTAWSALIFFIIFFGKIPETFHLTKPDTPANNSNHQADAKINDMKPD